MDKKKINAQVERFRKGFPWLDIVASATPERGIERLSEAQADEAVKYADTAETAGRCKFVPASGAASRMFKDIFAGMDEPSRKKAFAIAQELRRNGISAEIDLMGRSIKAQFKYAGKTGAKYVAVIDSNELENGVMSVKNMSTSTSETVAFPDAVKYFK